MQVRKSWKDFVGADHLNLTWDEHGHTGTPAIE